jgi:hypothetical protein
MTARSNQNTLACCECNMTSKQTKTTTISSIFSGTGDVHLTDGNIFGSRDEGGLP